MDLSFLDHFGLKKFLIPLLFPAGEHKRRVRSGALKGMWFTFDLRVDTQRWRGIYEQSLQDWLVKYTKPGSVCVDVGGSDGYFALLMAKLAGEQGRVYTFEPSFLNQAIQPHFEMNRALFPLAPVVVDGRRVVAAIQDPATEITVDALMDSEKLTRLDVVKIDVDGAEADVLNGMRRAVARFKPHIYLEVHSRDLLREVTQITSEMGYKMVEEAPPGYEVRPIDFCTMYYSVEEK